MTADDSAVVRKRRAKFDAGLVVRVVRLRTRRTEHRDRRTDVVERVEALDEPRRGRIGDQRDDHAKIVHCAVPAAKLASQHLADIRRFRRFRRLVDARFYHLDTCFCPLDGGYVMYYPPAFDAESNRTIERLVPSALRVPIEEADALHFACNAVNIGSTIIMNRCGSALRSLGKEKASCSMAGKASLPGSIKASAKIYWLRR